MAPTTLPPAERPRVTPPWPRSPSCRTRNPHNVVGDVGILSSLGLPGRRVPMLLTGGIYKGSKSSKFALEAALNRSGVEEHIPGIYLGYS